MEGKEICGLFLKGKQMISLLDGSKIKYMPHFH